MVRIRLQGLKVLLIKPLNSLSIKPKNFFSVQLEEINLQTSMHKSFIIYTDVYKYTANNYYLFNESVTHWGFEKEFVQFFFLKKNEHKRKCCLIKVFCLCIYVLPFHH